MYTLGMPGPFFPPPTQRKLLVSNPDRHHGTCVMHVRIANPRWRNLQFYVSSERPMPFHVLNPGIRIGDTSHKDKMGMIFGNTILTSNRTDSGKYQDYINYAFVFSVPKTSNGICLYVIMKYNNITFVLCEVHDHLWQFTVQHVIITN